MILVLNSLTGANVYENVLHCGSHARIQFKEWLVIIHWLITLLSWLCILLVKCSIVVVRHDWLSLHEYYSFMGLGMLLWLPTFLEVTNGEASLETASGKGEQVMLLH